MSGDERLALAPGAVIAGTFRIERQIGRGDMSNLYEAHHQKLDVRVALKVLRPEDAMDLKRIDRFIREARLTARVESDHVARLLDFGVCPERHVPYMAFELLSGDDLSGVLAARGPLPLEQAVGYVIGALAGLAAAHVEGITHRDLKPANLFLTATRPGHPSIVKVLDFGVAKAVKGAEFGRGLKTSTSTIVGSPLYMAPEQLRNSSRVDARADIWSLGVVLYELLAGVTPFDSPTLAEFITAVMSGSAVPLDRYRPDLPPAVGRVISKCLERRRSHRYQTVAELGAALEPFAPPDAREPLETIQQMFGDATSILPLSARDSSEDIVVPDKPALLGLAKTVVMADAPHHPTGANEGVDPSLTGGAGLDPSLTGRTHLLRWAAVAFVVISVGVAIGFFVGR